MHGVGVLAFWSFDVASSLEGSLPCYVEYTAMGVCAARRLWRQSTTELGTAVSIRGGIWITMI